MTGIVRFIKFKSGSIVVTLTFYITSLIYTAQAQTSFSEIPNKNSGDAGHVIIGSSMPGNIESFRLFKKIKLGNSILTSVSEDQQKMLEMMKFCRENNIYINFGEVRHRGSMDYGWGWGKRVSKENYFSKKVFDAIIDEAGPYYFGRYSIGEMGLRLYGPESYEVEWRGDTWPKLPQVTTMEEAKIAYVEYTRQWINTERSLSKGPLINVEAGMTFKYLAPAGLDKLCLEMMPGDPHLMVASIRGAARAFNKPWGAHIAMAWYGGISLDELWQKRWKTSLYYSYISGAQFIWKESSPIAYNVGEPKLDFKNPKMKQTRRILREAYQFAGIHSRPAKGPKVRVGIVYGNNDGSPGLWNRVAWGQYGDQKWLEGPAERGWNLTGELYRKEKWSNEMVQGEIDFSGNPPYGQYDVVPIEASPDVLKRYSALIFLGWNNMTDEIYEKLKNYVSGGGHLVMYVPQLSTETDRGKEIKLFRNGDFSDLFGVKVLGPGRKKIQGIKCMANASIKSYHFPKWRIETDPRFLGLFTPARVQLTGGKVISGFSDSFNILKDQLESRPVLVENHLGAGYAYLVTVYEFPADNGIIRFTKDLLRTVLQGEQADIRAMCNDRIRYAVYEGTLPGSKEKYETIYFLNTDPDNPGGFKLWIRGKFSQKFELPANKLRIAYLCGNILLVPEHKTIDLANWKAGVKSADFKFYSATNQRIELFNPGSNMQHVSINGLTVTIKPGDHAVIKLERTIDPLRKTFYDKDFLFEPEVDYPANNNTKR